MKGVFKIFIELLKLRYISFIVVNTYAISNMFGLHTLRLTLLDSSNSFARSMIRPKLCSKYYKYTPSKHLTYIIINIIIIIVVIIIITIVQKQHLQ